MKKISIIIPAFNEEKNIPLVYNAVKEVFSGMKEKYVSEIIFVNDGSSDGTIGAIEKIAAEDDAVKYIDFSRNFGKEIATTAGICHSSGDACIMIDSDMQHPPKLIPEFIAKWEEGFDVVVGIRDANNGNGFIKKTGSIVFYKIINKISEMEIVPNATDFRLIDRVVVDEFKRFTETKRMTRALIDWLGFKRSFIEFKAAERAHGTASYSVWKLLKLAVNSFTSLSLFPLTLAGYLGIFITLISGMMGFYILLGKYFFHWGFASTFSDAENLAILIVFLVGIILISLGLIALYIANIHGEVINRPMYVIRRKKI